MKIEEQTDNRIHFAARFDLIHPNLQAQFDDRSMAEIERGSNEFGDEDETLPDDEDTGGFADDEQEYVTGERFALTDFRLDNAEMLPSEPEDNLEIDPDKLADHIHTKALKLLDQQLKETHDYNIVSVWVIGSASVDFMDEPEHDEFLTFNGFLYSIKNHDPDNYF